jgi:hypothetical protein
MSPPFPACDINDQEAGQMKFSSIVRHLKAIEPEPTPDNWTLA